MEYVPERGDVVWITFNPQAGRRPALVVSPGAYNGKAGLALFCPITRQTKGYAFEVAIPEGQAVNGVVLTDQIKSLDWRARQAEYADTLPDEVTNGVLDRVMLLLS